MTDRQTDRGRKVMRVIMVIMMMMVVVVVVNYITENRLFYSGLGFHN